MLPNQSLHEEVLQFLASEWRLCFGSADPHTFDLGNEVNAVVAAALAEGRTETNLRTAYDALAPFAEQVLLLHPFESAFMIGHLVRTIEREKPSVVVDAGCGVALPLGFLARRFPHISFIGYDLSPLTVIRARDRLERLGCTNVEVVTGSHEHVVDLVGGGVADFVFTKQAYMDAHHLGGVSLVLKEGGLFLYLQTIAESFHARLIPRARLFGLTEEVSGRTSVPESRQARDQRWKDFARGVPQDDADTLADIIALRKGHPPFFGR